MENKRVIKKNKRKETESFIGLKKRIVKKNYICSLKLKTMSIEKIQMDKEKLKLRKKFPDFKSGDTINVYIKIREGNKERVQQFQGTVIQRKGVGTNSETFTIRKISDSIAVEKIIPLFSPNIEKIDLVRKSKVRRARLFYLRKRKGKQAKIKEKI